MTSKIFRLLSLGVILIAALACSLSDDDPTASTAQVSGALDQDLAALSKATDSSTLRAAVEYLDGTTSTVTIASDFTFSFTATAGKPFFLSFYFVSDTTNTPYLSRYFGALTSGTTTSGTDATVNAVTAEYSARLKTALGFVPGTAVSASNLANLSTSITTITELMFGPGGVFSATGSGLTATFISLINAKITQIGNLDTNNLSSYFSAIENIDDTEVIEFESGTDTGNAAPGVVTAFSFPTAVSSLGDSVLYTATVGSLDVEVDSTNKLVKFIPSADLIGSTLTLTVSASTGGSVTGTFTATITVISLNLEGQDLFTLNNSSTPYSLLYGPVADGTNFYVVADKSGVPTIEKYAMSDLSNIDSSSGVQDLAETTSYAVARSFSDMIISNDVAYVVDSLSGIVKYDLTSTASTYTSQTTSNFTASTLALAGSKLLAFNQTEGTFASLDTSSSSADVSAETLSGTSGLVASDIGSFGDYFYVSGTASGNYTYDFYTNALAYADSFTSAYEFLFENDASGISTSLFGTSSSTETVVALSFTGSTLVPEYFTNSTASSATGVQAVNGSVLLANSFTNTATAYSLTSADSVSSTELNVQSTYTVDFDLSTVPEAYAMVINLPEGSTVANTTSRLFVPAVQNTSSNTPTWFLKAYDMTGVAQ